MVKEHEYARRAWYCTILGYLCERDGNCHMCEHAHRQKELYGEEE